MFTHQLFSDRSLPSLVTMQSTLSAIELDISEIAKNKYASKRPDPVERSTEDDVAIAEAVAEVETELQEQSKHENEQQSWILPAVGVAVIAVSFYFLVLR